MTRYERGWLLPPAAILFALGILAGRSAEHWLPFLIALPCAIAACLIGRRLFRFMAVLACVFIIGGGCGFISWHPPLPPEKDYLVTGYVSDQVLTGANGQIKTVLRDVTLDGQPFSSGCYWSFYADEVPAELIPGKEVRMTASLYYPQGASNPGGYDFREELMRRDILVGLYGQGDLEIHSPAHFSFSAVTAAARQRLCTALTGLMGEETGGYAATMLLGLRSMIPGEDREAFSRLGIAHILAVSGFHVGILISAFGFLFHLLHLRPGIRLILFAVILAIYAALCGMNQPVIRASLLLLLSRYGKKRNRPRSGLHLLSACWILMLLVSPVQLTGISFQLSFGAVLGITLITPFLSNLIHPVFRVSKRIHEGLAVGLGVQIGILLPELSAFQELPLLGLIINIPVAVISSLILGLYWLTLLLSAVPGVNALLGSVSAQFTTAMVHFIRRLASSPGITLWTHTSTVWTWLGVLLLFVALSTLLRLKTRTRAASFFLGVAITILSVLPWPHHGTEYILFDVNNADASVLWDQDSVIVMDTGYDDHVLSSWLHRECLTPDAVILTHLHADHAGGLKSLLEDRIPIRRILMPEAALSADVSPDVLEILNKAVSTGAALQFIHAGDTLTLPSGSLTVLWPEKGKTRPGQDPNESSLATLFTLYGTRMLHAGDLSGKYEMYAATPADLLKVAHHGSVSSSSEAFMDAVHPRVLLVSTGNEKREDQFNALFPSAAFFSTKAGGAITVSFEENGIYRITPWLNQTNGDDMDGT